MDISCNCLDEESLISLCLGVSFRVQGQGPKEFQCILKFVSTFNSKFYKSGRVSLGIWLLKLETCIHQSTCTVPCWWSGLKGMEAHTYVLVYQAKGTV